MSSDGSFGDIRGIMEQLVTKREMLSRRALLCGISNDRNQTLCKHARNDQLSAIRPRSDRIQMCAALSILAGPLLAQRTPLADAWFLNE